MSETSERVRADIRLACWLWVFIALAVSHPGFAQELDDEFLAIRPGGTHEVTLTAEDPELSTPTLEQDGIEIRARSFRVEFATPGTYHIDLQSYEVDPYLVLRDSTTGDVLDEDDNSLLGTHARLVIRTIEPDAKYRVDAGARRSMTGKLEIRVLAGAPDESFEGRPEAAVEAEVEDRRRRIAVLEEMRGRDDPETLEAVSALGAVLFRAGRVQECQPLFERVFRTYEKISPDDAEQIVAATSNLALVLMTLGKLEEARPLMKRAFELAESTLGPDHPGTATNLNNWAGLLQALGDLEEARPLFERSLRYREAIYGPEHPAVAETCVNLALLLRSTGDYATARPLLERAKKIHETAYGKEHPMTAWSQNTLALLLHDLGNLDEAQRLYEHAIATFEARLGARHPMTTTTIGNLAMLLEDRGDLAKAREYYESALEIEQLTRGPEDPHVATLENNLGSVLRAQGDLDGALALGESVLRSRERTYGSDHPFTAEACNNLAVVLTDRGELERATKLAERALRIREATFGAFHPQTARSLRNLAWLRLDLGDFAGARDFVRRAIRSDEEQRRRLIWSLSEAERLAFAYAQRGAFHTYLALTQYVAPDAAQETYEVVLEWKSRVWRSLVQTRGQALERLDETDRTRVEAMRRIQSRLAEEAYRSDVDDPKVHSRRIAHLLAKRRQIESALVRSIGPTEAPPTIHVPDLANALPTGTVVLDFLVHPRHDEMRHRESPSQRGRDALSVWVLRSGEPSSLRWIDLGEAEPVYDAVRDVLARIEASYGLPVADPKGGHATDIRLRQRLFDPIRETIGDATRIVISADSFLGSLPFEVIRLADGSFLIEKYSIVYTQDVTSLALPHRKRPAAESDPAALLCVGGVAYDEPWSPLAATIEEARAITSLHARTFPESKRSLLLDREANEAQVCRDLPEHSVIHLATHGFFESDDRGNSRNAKSDRPARDDDRSAGASRIVESHPALLSGLVFATSPATLNNPNPSDGRLTAEEISFLDLSQAKLVVLSSCESGLGAVFSGEGMLGLRRTLRTAGAEAVIASLWKVADDATLELMRAFYERFWTQGQSVEQALRGAKLDRLRANREAYEGAAVPFTWAAFVLDTGTLY